MSNDYHMEDEVLRSSYDGKTMRRLMVFVRPHRNWMAVAAVLLLGAAILSSLNPVLIRWAIDHYINNPERIAADADAAKLALHDQQGLMRFSLLIAGLLLLEVALRYVQLMIVAQVGQITMLKMRMDIFEHLQKMSLRFLDRNPVGRLMTRVTNDVEKIQQTIVSGVVQVISDCMTILVVLLFMLLIDWRLTLVALIPLPFIATISLLFRKYAHQSFLEIRKRIARLNAFLQENIGGMRIIQIFGREDLHYEEYRQRNQDHRDEWLRQVRYFALYFPSVEFFGTLSVVLILLYTGMRMLHGDGTPQPVGLFSGGAHYGTLFAFVFLAERFFGPIRSLADRYNLLLEAMASSERVLELLDTPEDIQSPPDAIPCDAVKGEVEFDGLWFHYGDPEKEDPDWILRDIQLSIAAGEAVAVVGHTGAGKSTLINLLSRFYDVNKGVVRVDGTDVRAFEKTSLRRRIGVVLQDVFLFSGSVEENIRLGDESMTDDEVRAAADYVNAAKFIDKLPGGYSYDVGERGCNLSTGQRQLLAFARALAHQPDILVLDEATSSVDTETEFLIQDAIGKLMAGRTSIVIAHRLSTVQHADRIVVMHHGEIREVGKHQELLAQNGLYRTLYELQYKDQ
jgi:ATP-binding cassette, subfamily B, multidrug efflux pump